MNMTLKSIGANLRECETLIGTNGKRICANGNDFE
jgi:hypothetical protein